MGNEYISELHPAVFDFFRKNGIKLADNCFNCRHSAWLNDDGCDGIRKYCRLASASGMDPALCMVNENLSCDKLEKGFPFPLKDENYREAQCCATCRHVDNLSGEYFCGKLTDEGVASEEALVDMIYVCDSYRKVGV